MNCSKCGTYIADGWRYCKGCGSEAGPPVSPHQAETIRLGAGRPSPSNDPTLILNNPPWNAPDPPTAETVQSPSPKPPAAPAPYPQVGLPPAAPAPPQPRRSNNALLPIVIVVGILALGAVTLATLLMTGVIGNQNSGGAGGRQTNDAPDGKIGGSGNASTAETPTPDVPNTNTTKPPDDSTAVRGQVMSAINAWADSIRRRDLNDNLSHYADLLDVYYGSSNVSSGTVRSNRALIFNRYYDSTDVQISDESVEVSPDGNHAEVTYDNTYNWRGGSKSLSGKSRNKIVMDRRDGRWLITSEIHVSQYYENRGG